MKIMIYVSKAQFLSTKLLIERQNIHLSTLTSFIPFVLKSTKECIHSKLFFILERFLNNVKKK